jgi:hypothetical protein
LSKESSLALEEPRVADLAPAVHLEVTVEEVGFEEGVVGSVAQVVEKRSLHQQWAEAFVPHFG